ncbi:MAG: CPBP family intramembrane metalloprotease [Deltaproteobacteria bacterium]|nr:CPBP family intramembrane metalloprotease [Deltaproteobacteria bacterium]
MTLDSLAQWIGAEGSPLLMWGGPRASLGLPFIDGIWGAVVKSALPMVAFIAVAPLLWWFFRGTWKELDAEATEHRLAQRDSGSYDYRPAAMFAIVALILTAQEYYGGSRFFSRFVRPWLHSLELAQQTSPGGLGAHVDLLFWGEMYSYGWWAVTRIAGYTVIPFLAWKLIFRRDSLLDIGLRTRGFLKHAWIYGVCLAVVLPVVFIVSRSEEFATYYPFYKQCSRSWFDLLVWEVMYIGQFFALEVFFRGFMLVPLRKTLGSGAIFAMCVPYVMIHYGKPYLEASTAFLAGVALGSLAMKTRSIYAGFLVHCTVALAMDSLAILAGGGFPTSFWPR